MAPKKTTRKMTAAKTTTRSSDPSEVSKGDTCAIKSCEQPAKVALGVPGENGYKYIPVCAGHEQAYYDGNEDVRNQVANG